MRSVASDAEKREALTACARLVREHAACVLNGDFSAFPALVYVVQHVDRRYPTGEVRRLIGVYASLSEATRAIDQLRTKPGFVVRQDGFEVDCFEINGTDWRTGIPIAPSQQETEFFLRVLQATSLAQFEADERRQIEAEWLSRFSAFQDQFEVSVAKARAVDHPERKAALARYSPNHSELQRSRTVLIEQLRSHPIALECWEQARESGFLSARFVAFIDEGLRSSGGST